MSLSTLTVFVLLAGIGKLTVAVMNPSLSAHYIINDRANVILVMKGDVKEVISSFNTRSFRDPHEKTIELRRELGAFTSKSQQNVLSFLKRRKESDKDDKVVIKSFYITNRISIRNAPKSLIVDLMKNHGSEIEEIRHSIYIEPYKPILHTEDDPELTKIGDGKGNLIPWSIENTQVPLAHTMGYTGQNIVVAIVDSGVKKEHDALKDRMRPTYNWFDAQNHTLKPFDKMGHGTHCAGTILGGNGIGVSPNSQWIGCRIFDKHGAHEEVIFTCAEFIFCPTLPDGSEEDCTKRPNVVSNSWGGGRNQPWFNDAILAWRAAHIIPVFAIGNEGPTCSSANSPGDQDELISVGACTALNSIATFSSRGPAYNTIPPKLKPEVCAPGFRIISSYTGREPLTYASMSGTSMATPHVAGAVAVLLSKKPTATFTEILDALTKTAAHPEIHQSIMHSQCYQSGVGNNTGSWPNNIYGYGVIRLPAALEYLKP